MSLTREQLMAPRYKVIADYPNAYYNLGVIITDKGDNNFFIYDGYQRAAWFDRYPHLFKPLDWWNDRKLEELPEYVKVNDHGEKFITPGIYKIIYTHKNNIDEYNRGRLENGEPCSLNWVEPATLHDYEQYIKEKQ